MFQPQSREALIEPERQPEIIALRDGRVGPTWWLPALAAIGTAVAVKGVTMLDSVGAARSFCHELVTFNSTMGRLIGSNSSPNCGALDASYRLGLVLAVAGAGAALVGGLGLAHRSRTAAKAESPWPLRRATHRVAGWIDGRLPGPRGARPRLRPGYITALAVVLALVGVGAAQSAISAAQRSQQLQAYKAAQRVLAQTSLPAAIQRKPSGGCGSPICAYSRLTPPELEPMLERMFDARPLTSLARFLAYPALLGGHRPVVLRGQVEGYPLVATVFWHVVFVRHGRAPRGSIRLPQARGRVFLLGSDIDVAAAEPNVGS